MTDNTKPKSTKKMIYDPETGKRRTWREGDPEPRSGPGRPNLGLARGPGAPRIEGQPASQYVDNTGRKNPGAWEPGKSPVSVKPHVSKQMQALCQTFGMEAGFATLFNIALDPETRSSEKIKAIELVLAYGFGRPRVQVDLEVGTKSDEWNSAIAALDKRNAALGVTAPFSVPVVSAMAGAAFVAAADVIEAPFREADDNEDE